MTRLLALVALLSTACAGTRYTPEDLRWERAIRQLIAEDWDRRGLTEQERKKLIPRREALIRKVVECRTKPVEECGK